MLITGEITIAGSFDHLVLKASYVNATILKDKINTELRIEGSWTPCGNSRKAFQREEVSRKVSKGYKRCEREKAAYHQKQTKK